MARTTQSVARARRQKARHCSSSPSTMIPVAPAPFVLRSTTSPRWTQSAIAMASPAPPGDIRCFAIDQDHGKPPGAARCRAVNDFKHAVVMQCCFSGGVFQIPGQAPCRSARPASSRAATPRAHRRRCRDDSIRPSSRRAASPTRNPDRKPSPAPTMLNTSTGNPGPTNPLVQIFRVSPRRIPRSPEGRAS